MNITFEIPEQLQAQLDAMQAEIAEIKKLIQESTEDKLLTVSEVAQLFRVSRTTVYSWLESGKINSITAKGKRFFRKSDLVN